MREAKPATEPGAPARPSKKKLSYNEQRELDGMEAAIEAAEAKVAQLEAALSGPEALADHRKMSRISAELAGAQGALTTLYTRWQELDERR